MLSRFFFALLVFTAAPLPSSAAEPGKVIPLEFGPRPMTTVTFGDHAPVKLVFDTGAMGTSLDTSLARSYGLPEQGVVRVGSPGGKTPHEGFITTFPSLTVGDATLQNVRAVAVDSLHKQGEVGVLSPSSFAGSLVAFEFARSRAVVLPKTADTLPKGEATPYQGPTPGHGLPSLAVSIDGQTMTALLDSGAGYGLTLPLALAKTLRLKKPLTPREAIPMMGGTLAAYTGQLDGTFTVGPVTVKDPEILVLDGLPVVTVGIQILRGLTIVLDPEEQRSWVLPANAI